MSGLIDTHAHFDDFEAEGIAANTIAEARAAGVERIVAIGGGPAANRLALRLAREHQSISAACGYDRDLAGRSPDHAELEELLAAEQVVAVGECGLDYHYGPETAAEQKRLFELNLELALKFALPVVVHSRDADEDTLALLADYAAACDPTRRAIGVLHCYTRERAMARRLLDLGFHISFSGIVTFRNADPLRAVAAYLPLERIVIETDSPYLAPAPLRGRRNSPALLPHIAACLAEVRAVPTEEFTAATTANAKQLFGFEQDEL
jgi:TatD DNase family protein